MSCWFVITASHADTHLVRLTSLDWPPYTSESLAEKGFSTLVVNAAFAAEGYQLQVSFFPWSRAVLLAKQEEGEYDGYFPEYFAHSVARQFLFSETIGSSPLGLAYHQATPFDWQNDDDLRRYTVGIVQDYINTQTFDRNVALGRQSVEVVTNDWQNVKKLAAQHLRVAVIDGNVLAYLQRVRREPQFQVIRFHPRLLETKPLYVCFRKSKRGQHLQDVLSRGLKKIDAPQLIRQWHIAQSIPVTTQSLPNSPTNTP